MTINLSASQASHQGLQQSLAQEAEARLASGGEVPATLAGGPEFRPHHPSKTGECDGAEGTVLVLPPRLCNLSVSFDNPEKWHVG